MKCLNCKQHKELECFSKNKSKKSGYNAQCKDCRKSYVAKNKDSIDRYHLKERFNISLEKFNMLLEEQKHKCYICKSTETGTGGRFAVDHDHRCCPGKKSCGECVRGLLCRGCNIVVGYVEKSRLIDFDFESYFDRRI